MSLSLLKSHWSIACDILKILLATRFCCFIVSHFSLCLRSLFGGLTCDSVLYQSAFGLYQLFGLRGSIFPRLCLRFWFGLVLMSSSLSSIYLTIARSFTASRFAYSMQSSVFLYAWSLLPCSPHFERYCDKLISPRLYLAVISSISRSLRFSSSHMILLVMVWIPRSIFLACHT